MTSSSDGNFVFEARGEREIVMAYSFEVAPKRLFEAWTSCESMTRWYGPEGHELIVCDMDLCEGGTWRFVTRDELGKETALRGVHQETVAPMRLVHTELWEEMPDFVTIVTSTLKSENTGTRMKSVVVHPATESHDGAIAFGMEWGVRQTFERLAAHLAATQWQAAGGSQTLRNPLQIERIRLSEAGIVPCRGARQGELILLIGRL